MHGRRWKGFRAALGAMLLFASVLAAVVVAGTTPASAATVVATIGVGTQPAGISSDGTHVWVTNSGANTVSEIDASTGVVVATIPVGTDPAGVSSDGTDVWVANYDENSVSEIDASTGVVVATIPVGVDPAGVSSDGTDVWVANLGSGTVSEIDASTGVVVATIPVGVGPDRISSDGTDVWVANLRSDNVSEIDASTGVVVATINVGNEPYGISSDGTDVWVANLGNDNLSEIDASTGSVVATIGVGSYPDAVSSDGTHVWVANYLSNTVSEIDASTGVVVATIDVGGGPQGVSSDGTDVWTANYGSGTVSEIAVKDPQTVAFTSPDPSPVVVGGADYTPTATGGGSTSPVVISLDPTSTGCTLDNGVVAFTAVGTCIIDANQAGDANYTAAPQATQTIAVTAGDPGPPVSVDATAGPESADVTWSAPASDGDSALTGYVLTANDGVDPPTTVTITDPSATSGVIGGLTDGVDYDISVAATNGVGTGQATDANENPIEPLGTPVFTSGPSATFTVGSSGTFSVTAAAAPAVSGYSETGGLPDGVTLNADGTLAGTPAAGTGGTYPITITATNGAGSTATQSFTLYVASATTVSAVTPNSGPGAGGTKVTVTGTGLGGATEVLFGSVPGTITSVNAKGTLLEAVSPSEAAGPVDVTVTTTANGTSLPTSGDVFDYLAPVATSVTASGPGAGGTRVRILGRDLQGATSVDFGTTSVPVTLANGRGTAVWAFSPAGSGTVSVTVTTPGGTSSQDVTFTYLAPAIRLLQPASGPAAGGNTVTVTGNDLEGATFEIGSTNAPVVSINGGGTVAEVKAPGQSAGTDAVSATTRGGTSASTSADVYTYLAPTVTKVTPAKASTGGGTTVTVHGANLQGATAVSFGGVPGTITAVAANGTTATVVSPAHGVGSVDITVTTAKGGTSQVSADDQFTYATPAVR